MKFKSLILLPITLGAISASPFITSCSNNHGQSYNNLKLDGSFSINSKYDANNIKAKALTMLPVVQPGQTIDILELTSGHPNDYWEFVYALGNYAIDTKNIVDFEHITNSDTFTLLLSKDSTAHAFTFCENGNYTKGEGNRIYTKASDCSYLPDELKSYLSQIYFGCKAQ